MTPQDLCVEARDRLNHLSTTVLTDDRVTRAFNAALERWAMDTLSLERVLLVDVIANQQDYDRLTYFPDMIELSRVTYRDADGALERLLPYVPEDELPLRYRDNIGGPPCVYSMRGDDTLLLWPQPNTTILAGLALYATVLPPTFLEAPTNASVLPFPRTHREGLVRGICLLLCELNLEDHTLAARLPLALESYTSEMERVTARSGQPDGALVFGGRVRRQPAFGPAPYDPVTGQRFTVIGR